MGRIIDSLVAGVLATGLLAAGAVSASAASGSAASGSAASASAASASHAPRWATWASTNWSGYVVQRAGVRSVAGSWVVPSVARTATPSFSATWIGIGGFQDSRLVQLGTEQDSAGGITTYSAWWELLPYAQQVVDLTVRPGDRIRASIASTSAGWRLTLRDVTTGHGFSTVVGNGGSAGSAEWIEEPPLTPWGISTLADYRTVTFDDGRVNGSNPRLIAAEAGRIIRHGTVLSMPSSPDATTDGFTIRYGSSVPVAPRG